MKISEGTKQEKLFIFFLLLLTMAAAYGIMLSHRFSTDGYSDYYKILEKSNAFGKLESSRISGAVTEACMSILGINTVTVQFPFTILFILTITWVCYDLWGLICQSFHEPDCYLREFLLIFILPAFINISFGEMFFFSNVAIHWSGMILTGHLSMKFLFTGDRFINKILAVCFLTISLGFYQAVIGYFVIWGLLIAALRGRLRPDGRSFGLIRQVIGVALVSSALSVLTQCILRITGIIPQTARLFSVESVMGNIRYLITEGIKEVFGGGMHFLGYFLGVLTVFLLLWLLRCLLKYRCSLDSVSLVLVLTAVCFAVPFAPHIIIKDRWLSPRSMFSFFSFLSFCGIMSLYLENYYQLQSGRSVSSGKKNGRLTGQGNKRSGRQRRYFRSAGVCLICIFLFLNMAGIFKIGVEQIRSNTADKYQAMIILERIRRYEEKSGNTITGICFIEDNAVTYANPEAPDHYMDINTRAGATVWQRLKILEFYSGRSFRNVDLTQELQVHYFEGKEWDSFLPEEQLVFCKDTLFIGVY